MKNDQIIIQEDVLQVERREKIIDEMERTKWKRYWAQVKKDWALYLMLIPVIMFFFLVRYLPISGIMVAFKNYDNALAIGEQDFYGFFALKNLMFSDQTRTVEFWRAFRNTFSISMYGLIFGFPIPIILALFFSEIKNELYRSITQILSYLPNFISMVVITSIVSLMLAGGNQSGTVAPGVITQLLINLGVVEQGVNIRIEPEYFRSIYIISDIWQGAGYGSIVYFAAIMGINPVSYEAARIDGANKLAQVRYVTLPGMAPTLTIMLILRIGSVLSVGFEKVLLLYDVQNYSTSDVLSTYVIRLGSLMSGGGASGGGSQISVSFAGAADLFNSLIAMMLVLGANFVSRRVSETSLF